MQRYLDVLCLLGMTQLDRQLVKYRLYLLPVLHAAIHNSIEQCLLSLTLGVLIVEQIGEKNCAGFFVFVFYKSANVVSM